MNKQAKIGIVISMGLVLLIGAAGALKYFSEQAKIIKEKDPGLTSEERKIYEDRLNQTRETLNNPEITSEQRFNLYMNEGFQLYGLGKYVDAKTSFENAIGIKPDDSNVYVALYQVLADMNDNRRARTSIKKAIELRPDSPDIWKKYILFEQERFDASEEQLEKYYTEAIDKTTQSPNRADMITAYAVFLESSNQLDRAIQQWRAVIEIYPERKTFYEQEIQRLESKL